jgi:tetratricopeptide (TPR) repeat protein
MALRVVPSVAIGERRRRFAAAARPARLPLVLLALAWLCAAVGTSHAQTMPGEVSVSTADGFARLIFRFRAEVGATVRAANNIVVVSFSEPVDVNVERLNANARDYISAARLDPDGKAVRIALAQKVKANLTGASERVFLDLLPESWTGITPGLPQDVVEDLARRARDAERRARIRQQLANRKRIEPTRVRFAEQPTFVRFTIPLTGNIAVASDRGQNGLTLVFDAPLRFDFADALVALPPYITSIEPKLDEDASSVVFTFNRKVDVRTFREDNNYVVDLSVTSMSQPNSDAISRAIEGLQRGTPGPGSRGAPTMAAPQTVPAASPAAVSEPQPRAAAPPAPRAAAPPTREATEPAAPTPAPAQAALPRAAAVQPAPPAPRATAPSEADAKSKSVKAELRRADKSVRILFPFVAATPAAVFRRADVMWLVFDTETAVDVDALRKQSNGMIRQVNVSYADGQVIRLKLDRPRLGSLAMEGAGWALTIGDTVTEPSMPLSLNRTIVGPSRAGIVIPFENASRLHRITDPDVGDVLLVVSALEPARGVLKPQDFVELRTLASTHGIAVQPLADDVLLQITPDRVVITRPDGLALSAYVSGGSHRENDPRALFDIEKWTRDRDSDFIANQARLINAAADSPANQQSAIHRNLAGFYMARQMHHEAKGALDMALTGEHVKGEEAGMLVLRSVAQLMIGRTKEALQDLNHPSVGNQHDAPLWRALAYALDGKWAESREGFQAAQMSIGMLPIEMQRFMLQMSVRAAIEAGDIDGAANQLNDFETIGAAPEEQAAISVLRGRIAEKLGRTGDAIAAYQAAIDSKDRCSSAQARLRLALLQMKTEDVKRADTVAEIETVSVIWRGDRTEIEALQALARLYTEDGRLREAFGVMRTALKANARSELTRNIQDEAAATFESLFLSGRGEKLPAIDALSLFYDFRDLTPMGRRGDEMIRRLADRLVSVDLLDQAAELLEHQVNKRLQGAARGQVAARLAIIYLMNNKPDRALAALRLTHVAGFSDTLRNRRLLLEARALSELGRPDVALEVIGNVEIKEADRLRGDILWKARRWRQAAERIEATLSDRWRDWDPLTAIERNDVLRAAIGYALAEDALGAGRFRERYAPKMADGPDSRAFDVVSSPVGPGSAEFRAVASNVASIDTLVSFLRDMREGFGDLAEPPASPAPPQGAASPPASASTTGEAPAAATPSAAAVSPVAAPAAANSR